MYQSKEKNKEFFYPIELSLEKIKSHKFDPKADTYKNMLKNRIQEQNQQRRIQEKSIFQFEAQNQYLKEQSQIIIQIPDKIDINEKKIQMNEQCFNNKLKDHKNQLINCEYQKIMPDLMQDKEFAQVMKLDISTPLKVVIEDSITKQLLTKEISEDHGLFGKICQQKIQFIQDYKNVIKKKFEIDQLICKRLRMLICVTVYNEEYQELETTLDGIYNNLKEFISYGISPENIAVTVIFDGIQKIHQTIIDQVFQKCDQEYEIPVEKTLKFLKYRYENQNYQNMNNTVYMYQTYWNNINKNLANNQGINLTLFLAVKLHNGGKLSSHMWFFRGFCEMLNPHYTCLLDCGTKPLNNSLFQFFVAFETNKKLGGCCGYIYFEKIKNQEKNKRIPLLFKILLPFDIQSAQMFEMIVGHVTYKPFESLFGFCSVLPGAFCAYRWDALRTIESDSKNMLDSTYLESVIDLNYRNSDKYDLFGANMLLAEDRILTLEAFARSNYVIKYIPSAVARADAVTNLYQLFEQRRRWINGTLCAFWYSITSSYSKIIYNSSHSKFRIISYNFQMAIYVTISGKFNCQISFILIVLSFFSLSIQFNIFFTISNYFFEQFNIGNIYGPISVSTLLQILFFLGILFLIFVSLAGKAEHNLKKFYSAITFMSYFYYFIIVSYVLYFYNLYFSNTQAILGSQTTPQKNFVIFMSVGGFLIPIIYNILLHLKFNIIKELIWTAIPFAFYLPMFMISIPIYAYSRLDDISWGTREDKKQNQLFLSKLRNFKVVKYKYLMLNILSNMLVSIVFVIIAKTQDYGRELQSYFLLVFIYMFISMIFLFSTCAIIYDTMFFYWKQTYQKHIQKKKEVYQQQLIKEIYNQDHKLEIIESNGNVALQDTDSNHKNEQLSEYSNQQQMYQQIELNSFVGINPKNQI